MCLRVSFGDTTEENFRFLFLIYAYYLYALYALCTRLENIECVLLCKEK